MESGDKEIVIRTNSKKSVRWLLDISTCLIYGQCARNQETLCHRLAAVLLPMYVQVSVNLSVVRMVFA